MARPWASWRWRAGSRGGLLRGPIPSSSSALNGFLMMVVAFAIGQWLGTHMDGTVLPLTSGIWFWSTLIAASAWTLVQRHGTP